MFFSSLKAVLALVAIIVLSQASLSFAGYTRGVGHHRRPLYAGYNHMNIYAAKRADAGNVELPLNQI